MAQDNNYSYGGDAYTREHYDQYDSTISNGEARIPICFCVDTSSSMTIVINDPSETEKVYGTDRSSDGNNVYTVKPKYPWVKLVTRIQELQKVFSTMLTKMKANDIISNAAAICIITFDQFADCCMEFTDISRVSPDRPSKISIGKERTNVAKGLRMALDRLDQQEKMNRNAGNDSYRPVLVFMSDGLPTDSRDAERMRDEVRQLSEDGKLNVIPIGIGKGIDERWMRGLSKDSRVYHMNTDREFEEVFELITQKIWTTTMVIAGDEENNMASQAPEDVASTMYGFDNADFLGEFMNSDYEDFLEDFMKA